MNTQEISTIKRLPLLCETAAHKLLARINHEGIWLWCKACHCEHFVAWETIKQALDVK